MVESADRVLRILESFAPHERDVSLTDIAGRVELPKSSVHRLLMTLIAHGYALDLEEFEIGLRCIAAPVRDQSAHVIAAVGIAGPSSRLYDAHLSKLVPMVVDAADLLSRNLGFVPDHVSALRGETIAGHVNVANERTEERLLGAGFVGPSRRSA